MSNHWFRFKKFTIEQDMCAMKVGTDAVLLGAWCDVNNKKNALDIGTGTGIISLMIAQRNNTLQVDAIDIDEDAIMQAKANICASPYSKRISATLENFTTIQKNKKYDLIVSNPPFYQEDTKCPEEARQAARHTTSLPFPILINNVSSLLEQSGLFSVIIPNTAVTEFIYLCKNHGLHLKRRTDIVTTPKRQSKRTLLEFANNKTNPVINTLYIRDDKNAFTAEYLSLTKDFYLEQ